MGEAEGHVTQVVRICPTVEELKLKIASHFLLFKCPVKGCRAFSFKTQRSLTYHINAVHPQLNPYKVTSDKENGEDYRFQCPQADCVYSPQRQQRWFSSLEHLRYHYINTHDEKRFACSKCGKRFGWKRDQEHHEHECGQTFACETCPAKYPFRRSLLTHCLRKQHPVPPQYEKPKQKDKDCLTETETSTQPVSLAFVSAPAVSLSSPGVLVSPAATGVSLTSSCTPAVSLGSPGVLLSPASTGVLPVSEISGGTLGTSFTSVCVPSSASSADVTFSAPVTTLSSTSAPAVCPESPSSVTPLITPVSLSTTTSQLPVALSTGTSQPPVSLSNTPRLSVSPFSTSQPSAFLPSATSQHIVSLSNKTSQLTVSPSSAISQLTVSPSSTTAQTPVSLPSTRAQPPVSLSLNRNIPLSLVSDSHSESGKHSNVSQNSATPIHSGTHQSVSDKTSGTGSRAHRSCCEKSTTLVHSSAMSTGYRRKLRPILPKSQGIVVVRAGLPPSHGTQDHRTGMSDSHVEPWVSGEKMGDAAPPDGGRGPRGGGVSAGCQTNMIAGPLGGGIGGVQVPVVHMGTQVSVGAHVPLPTCHRGTQMYVPPVLRGDSTHTAVQTCVQMAHSGTQLAASLPAHSVSPQVSRTLVNMATQMAAPVLSQEVAPQVSRTLVNMSTQMEDRRQLCAVAIQTGDYVDVVNMAIQATTPHSEMAAGDGTVVMDLANLADHRSKSSIAMCVDGRSVTVGSCVAGTHTASQTSFPFVLLNKATSTNSRGTQAATELPLDESEVASTGMQTSVTLIHRPKVGVMVAQTQTCDDCMLPSAMTSFHFGAGSKWLHLQSKALGGRRMRKRSMRSREVQTQPCSPRRKKDRKKKTDWAHVRQEGSMQELSMATETLLQVSVQQTDTVSNKGNVGHSSGRYSKKRTLHSENNCSTSKGVQRDSNISSIQTQQNPPLSFAARKDNHQDVWDPFLTSPATVPSSSPPGDLSPQLDQLLSGYRVELGVQTPQDFLSSFTADFGMQTIDSVLSGTAELGVQTLDHSQERCTAELGVQTVTSVLGCLLENLDADLACGSLGEEVMDSASSSMSPFLSMRETSPASQLLTLDSQTQTTKATTVLQGHSVGAQSLEQSIEFGMDFDSSLPSPNVGTAPKLFDSFDSDLSFSDCGTGTEDFFASTHTQTAEAELTAEEDSLLYGLPSLYTQPEGQSCVSHTDTPDIDVLELTSHSTRVSTVNVFPAIPNPSCHQELGGLVGEEEMTGNVYQSDGTCPSSRVTSSCTTDTDLLSGVSAMDMHTQTADDLLQFLMNNMETQTTEDLSDNKMAVADTHTQTTTSVLLTPPPPVSPLGRNPAAWLGVEEGLVSAETQTSSHFLWDMQQDQDDLFDLADI